MTPMLRLLFAFPVIALYALSLYGWGKFVSRLRNADPEPWPLAIALGLAAWVFVGGLLNFLGIAFAWALDIVVIVGWAVALTSLRAVDWPNLISRDQWRMQTMRRDFVWAVVIAIGSFVISTQLSPAAYNWHDDFQKYMSHPVRMLETGTVFGSPLSSIGLQDLGGQAMIHAFVLAHFPIEYVNGSDAVFCLLLSLSIVVEFGIRNRIPLVYPLLAALLVFVIDPQYVNIGANYSASALIMALVVLMASPGAQVQEERRRMAAPSVLGLLYAGLIALKPTFTPFAALHFLCSVGVLALGTRDRNEVAKWATKTALFSILFIGPWIAVHFRNYWYVVENYANAGALIAASASAVESSANMFTQPDLFSNAETLYGVSIAHYTVLILYFSAVGLLPLVALKASGERIARIQALSLVGAWLAAVVAYAAYLFVLAPRILDSFDMLRYFCPVAIGLAPATAVLSVSMTAHAGTQILKTAGYVFTASMLILAIALFSPSATARVNQAISMGSVLAVRGLVVTPGYLAYNDLVMHGALSEKIAQIQAKIPANESLIAWVATPFYLDFRRNRIFDVDIGGLVNPWARLPHAQFVLWQYQGYGMFSEEDCGAVATAPIPYYRKLGNTCIEFGKLLRRFAGNSQVLYRDEQFILFRFNEEIKATSSFLPLESN